MAERAVGLGRVVEHRVGGAGGVVVSGLPEEHPRKGEQGGWLVAVMLGRGRHWAEGPPLCACARVARVRVLMQWC